MFSKNEIRKKNFFLDKKNFVQKIKKKQTNPMIQIDDHSPHLGSNTQHPLRLAQHDTRFGAEFVAARREEEVVRLRIAAGFHEIVR